MAFWQPARREPRGSGPTTGPEQKQSSAPRLTIRGRPFELWGTNWPNVDVVGESHYADGIRSLFPTGVNSSPPLECRATLIPDPSNPHDPNAVAVVVASKVVGYLARPEAARYSPVLKQLVNRGLIPVTACRVYASEHPDFDGRPKFMGSVTIALDEPHLIAPVNSPRGVHRMLPHGTALQLKDEENHMDVLGPLVANAGGAWVHATLHRLESTVSKSSKDLVQVRVDGRPIGTLTPAMSLHYLPTIAACDSDEALTAARVLLKGNPIKVEAVLYAAKAHELEAAWLRSEPESVGPRIETPAAAVQIPPSGAGATEASPDDQNRPTAAPPGTFGARSVPPKPTQIVFNSPATWPQPPEGYEPPIGWSAPPNWPDAPPGWVFWVAR